MLTPNHGHAALFGVFGMLALAVVVFGLRALASDGRVGSGGAPRQVRLLGTQCRSRR